MEEYEESEVLESKTRRRASGRMFLRGLFTGVAGSVLVFGACAALLLNVTGRKPSDGAGTGPGASVSARALQKIDELLGYVHLYYYDEAKTEDLENGLYAGLLEGLGDPYSEYYTKKEYEDLQISATQNYCGIGAALSQDRDSMQVTITHVYEGAPAEEAGLADGDVIVQVEEIEAVSMELSDLVTHIRGEEDSYVHLKVYRDGEEDYLEFDVRRANIDLPTVESKMLDENVGYVRILDFGAPTVKQFEDASAQLAAQGMKAMVIDVRDNPGGMITAVTGILDDILPAGTVVYTQDKYGKRQDYESDDEKKMDLPMAVLVNGNSASASEILAGAIRDFDYGTLIGTKTFGKGIVQTILSLEEGDAVKLTTAKYFTPKGENIHGTGIEPDILLEYEYQGDAKEAYDEKKDNQVLKAIEILNKEITAQ